MEFQRSRYNRALDLLIKGDLEATDFQEIKSQHEDKIQSLKKILDENPDHVEKFGLSIYNQGTQLLRLYDFYKSGNTINKRKLISLMFPSNITFNGLNFEAKQYGLAMQLIYYCG